MHERTTPGERPVEGNGPTVGREGRQDVTVAGAHFKAGLEFRGLGDDRKKMMEVMRGWFEKRTNRAAK